MTHLELLHEADELASHLWRIPAASQPAYKRVIFNLLGRITGVFA